MVQLARAREDPCLMTVCLRGVLRLCLAAVVTGVTLTLTATPAFAHVTVHPSSVAAGSSDVELTFRVPDEHDNSRTVKLQVFFPRDLPLLTVDVLPVPGWSDRLAIRKLSKPIKADDGLVSQVVTEITWTATAQGITPGHYEDFAVGVGAMPPRAGSLVFKALQSYSSGEIVRWIQVPTPGQPPPDTPAPVLTLTAAGHSGTAPAGASTRSSGSSDTLAVIALGLAVVAGGLSSFALISRRRSPLTDGPSGA
jgi:uncharacterized protein